VWEKYKTKSVIIIIIIIYSLFNDAFSVSQTISVDVGDIPAASAQFLLKPDSSVRAWAI
jgi:hypothetical protein